MKNKTVALCLLIVVCLIVGFAARKEVSGTKQSRSGFTINYKVTHFDVDGKNIESDSVRYVSSTGAFRDVETLPSGLTKELCFVPGKGIFRVDHRTQELVKDKYGSGVVPSNPTAEQLRANKQFVRTESVIGYQTYVSRVTNETTKLPEVENNFSVEFGYNPLKSTFYGSDGQIKAQIMATSVILGEPDPALTKCPDFNVKGE